MKAMILAAGVGSRLRPLTDETPKALLDVGGMPMIERVIVRLKSAGVTDLVVNLFHLGERIIEFLAVKRNFGMHIQFTREELLLDTGGGLKNAAWFFDDGRPFFLHNVDILSDIDLGDLLQYHHRIAPLVTLAVQRRPSGRQLLFDRAGQLCGRESEGTAEWAAKPVGDAEGLAFTGIHVVDPVIFSRLTETGAFPILQSYLRLAGEGERIIAYRADGRYWQDIGSPEKLSEARKQAAERDCTAPTNGGTA